MKIIGLIRSRQRVLTSAGMRVAGAVLVALGLVVGVRTLGPQEFGLSVLALAIGQLVAFPLTAMERLVIRLVANDQLAAARHLLDRARLICIALLTIAAVVASALALTGRSDAAFLLVSAGVSAVSAGLVVLRQGECRAAGHLAWGQFPNEIVRPIITLISYPLVAGITVVSAGVLATLIASAVTLTVILFAPQVRSATADHDEEIPSLGGAASSLMVVSAVAIGVERLYPVVLGWTSTTTAVTIFAIVLRVIQIANFAQMFSVFFYQPPIAAALGEGPAARDRLAALTSRVRWVGMASSVPATLICLVAPGLVETVIGEGLRLEAELRLAAVAILATAIGGPAQTLLIMDGREITVARVYTGAAVVSALAFVAAGAASGLAATIGLVVAFATWNVVAVFVARRVFGRWH